MVAGLVIGSRRVLAEKTLDVPNVLPRDLFWSHTLRMVSG